MFLSFYVRTVARGTLDTRIWSRRRPRPTHRPSHLQMPGEPKMAHAALLRRAICSNIAEKRGDACLLFGG